MCLIRIYDFNKSTWSNSWTPIPTHHHNALSLTLSALLRILKIHTTHRILVYLYNAYNKIYTPQSNNNYKIKLFWILGYANIKQNDHADLTVKTTVNSPLSLLTQIISYWDIQKLITNKLIYLNAQSSVRTRSHSGRDDCPKRQKRNCERPPRKSKKRTSHKNKKLRYNRISLMFS